MDPLAELKDIHLPQEIHNYPIALGWWILALLILLLIVFAAVKLRQVQIKSKAKKLALKRLDETNDATAAVTILKWSLLQYFPREKVANLSGDNLQEFLIATLPAKHHETFQQLSTNGFNTVYQRPFDENNAESENAIEVSHIVEAIRLWLNHALPAKKELPTNNLPSNQTTLTDKKEVSNATTEANVDSVENNDSDNETETSKISGEKS